MIALLWSEFSFFATITQKMWIHQIPLQFRVWYDALADGGKASLLLEERNYGTYRTLYVYVVSVATSRSPKNGLFG